MGKLKNICIVCQKEIPDNHPCLGSINGSICMGCEGVEINVYFIRLPEGKGKAGYYEKDPNRVMDIFIDCDGDTEYTIKKETMRAGVFHNLPDFEGF